MAESFMADEGVELWGRCRGDGLMLERQSSRPGFYDVAQRVNPVPIRETLILLSRLCVCAEARVYYDRISGL